MVSESVSNLTQEVTGSQGDPSPGLVATLEHLYCGHPKD